MERWDKRIKLQKFDIFTDFSEIAQGEAIFLFYLKKMLRRKIKSPLFGTIFPLSPEKLFRNFFFPIFSWEHYSKKNFFASSF